MLLSTAEIFKSKIRKEDLVGRWGGEEFLMVLTGSSAEDALHIGIRLRDEIEKTEYGQSRNISITVSIGIASSIGHNSIDSILKSADKALYQAKVNKNAVIIAERNFSPA